MTTDNNKKVDQSDAEFVEIVHSNALGKGKLEALGHIDFFPNGGMSQPGCKATTKTSTFLLLQLRSHCQGFFL